MSGEVLPAGSRLSLGSGGGLVVGRLLAEGGQGLVYEVAGDPGVVFKQIKAVALAGGPELGRKLEVMVAVPPPGWRESSGHVLLTWPLDTVLAGSRFVGFTMPRIDAGNSAELHVLANPSDRRNPGPKTPDWVRGFTWRYLLQTAANLAAATDALHSAGVVFGDFNERNMLVSKNALVTLVDCDSMQVPSPAGGAFLCGVGRAEFTAPELLNLDLKTVARKPSSDLFPLAVHIHQLLLEGAHPFDGVWHGAGEKPRRPQLAAGGIYVYAGDPRLTPHPLWIDYDLIPRSLQDMFRRAFVTGLRDPGLRPTGREWRDALTATSRRLKTCKRIKEHVYPPHHQACPWCEHQARRQTTQAPLPPARSTAPPYGTGTTAPSPAIPVSRRKALWVALAGLVAVLVLAAVAVSGSGTPPVRTPTAAPSHPVAGDKRPGITTPSSTTTTSSTTTSTQTPVAVAGSLTITGTLSVFAGNGQAGPPTAGPANSSELDGLAEVAVDRAGNLYIADRLNNVVEKVTPSGILSVVAGGGSDNPSTTPQAATSVALNWPEGVAVDRSGNLYIADKNNNVIEKVTPSEALSVIAGGGSETASTTPQPATSISLDLPEGVAVDSVGNVYISDTWENLVEKVTPSGSLSVIAGTGSQGTPTPGPATSSDIDLPTGLAVDSSGNVYIADDGNYVVEKVTPSGTLSIFAGGGSSAPSTTPEPATSIRLANSGGLAFDAAGNLYIADKDNHVVEKVTPPGALSVVAGGGTDEPSTTPQPATSVELSLPSGVAVDSAGDIYVGDTGDGVVDKVTPK